jgi:hypothetical protein
MWQLTLMISCGIGLTLTAIGILAHDVARELEEHRVLRIRGVASTILPRTKWRTAAALVMLAWASPLLAIGLLACSC